MTPKDAVSEGVVNDVMTSNHIESVPQYNFHAVRSFSILIQSKRPGECS
jgi:hypothetical protein